MQHCYRHRYQRRNFEERKHLFQMFKARTHKEKLSEGRKQKEAEGSHPSSCHPKNYSQHTNPNTTHYDQNNSSITPPAKEQTASCLVKSDITIVLQTSSACIMNKPEDQFCVIKGTLMQI